MQTLYSFLQGYGVNGKWLCPLSECVLKSFSLNFICRRGRGKPHTHTHTHTVGEDIGVDKMLTVLG